ncbi:MAG TPA: hypothetical protein VJX94_10015, partial [Stellaceae bacterium]|nr:hypothetical protein [Stellaceae bacterium]
MAIATRAPFLSTTFSAYHHRERPAEDEELTRCCYHGWLFDVDGMILETPGEPADSTLKDRLFHGAYPVHEYQGLVFA